MKYGVCPVCSYCFDVTDVVPNHGAFLPAVKTSVCRGVGMAPLIEERDLQREAERDSRAKAFLASWVS